MNAVAVFYCVAASATALFWAILSLLSGEDFHSRVSRCAVATRPSWLPAWVLLGLLRNRVAYLLICHALPAVLGLAAVHPDSIAIRVGAALYFSVYVLCETSHSHSHRDYANMYVTWALALLPGEELAQGFALGICIHFIASSGFSKLIIGGTKGWASPSTMRSVLHDYGKYGSLAKYGPGWPALNKFAVKHDAILSAISLSTLVFECIAVPAALLMTTEYRVLLVWASVALHLGIAAAQSCLIGLAFVPNVASYVFGFGAAGCDPLSSSGGWMLAVAVVCASGAAIALRRGRVLPEDWPCTPFALFPWSGTQWELLFERFARGRTRLVLATADCMGGKHPIGCRLIPKDSSPGPASSICTRAGVQSGEDNVVHDAWEQVIGETLVHSALLPAFDFSAMAKPDWQDGKWPARLTALVERWLLRDQRLVVIASGKPLVRAYLVRLHETDDRVVEVIA